MVPPIPHSWRGLYVTFRPKGIGWLSWDQLKEILKIAKGQFRTEAERKFVDDLIGCL